MDIDSLNGIQLLLRHHGAVRRRMRVLEGLMDALASREFDVREEAQESAREIVRYLEVYHPLHERDERLSLFPRIESMLREEEAQDAVVQQEISNAAQEHEEYEGIWQVLQECLWLVCTPDAVVSREQLEKSIAKVSEHFAEHFEREESYVFPAALRLLSPNELDELAKEIRSRHAGRFDR